jgi:cysteine-rich repeat protein
MTFFRTRLSSNLFLSTLIAFVLGACDQKPGDLGQMTDGDDALCGDGIVQPGLEQCDDGNAQDGDGCTANCTLEGLALCGDGIVHPQYEQCDDGNAQDGDGCTSTCQLEA